MLLLTVLTVASIVGTIYESNLDAKVARAYIYNAPWFGFWMLMLATNLICVALSRMPWKKHHTGFIVTHLGIVTMLAGAWIGRTWGIEGTMTIFKGDPPNNMLLIDEKVLQITDDQMTSQVIPLEIIHRQPSPARPWGLASTNAGWQLAAIDYSKNLKIDMAPKRLPTGGIPALHIVLKTSMMAQSLDSWLLGDEGEHSSFNMGLASIQLKKGVADLSMNSASPGAAKAGGAEEIKETTFAFAKAGEQISHSSKGGATGAKIHLIGVNKDSKGQVEIEYKGAIQSFDVAKNLGTPLSVPGTPFTLSIDKFWADFRIQADGPVSVSEEPNNPAVLVTLSGQAVPAAPATPESTAATGHEPPSLAMAAGKNSLTLFIDDSGQLTYQLASRKAGASSGKIEPGKPLTTGWADWQLTVDQLLPNAEEHFEVKQATDANIPATQLTEGVLVRAIKGGESCENWIPMGWQITMQTKPKPTLLAYGYHQKPLPVSLQLKEFEVERNEGSDSPAGFKSTVEITSVEGERAQGQCWMNNPISFPDSFVNTFSGLTYKLSQASWNPENLNQSTIQILRDPGWAFKWIGSLLIVSGIFTLFYLRPYPKKLKNAAPDGSIPAPKSP